MNPLFFRPGIRLLVVIAVLAACLGSAPPSPAQTFTWSRWPMPYPRYDHVAVYDPVRDRMVMNGGVSATEPDAGDSGETWSLSLDGPPRWEVLPASSTPRSRSVAVYDPPGERMVVFGGIWDGYRLDDTDQLQFTVDAWSRGFSGSAPPAGDFSAPAYDGLRHRMLAYPWQANVVCQLDLATNVWSTFATAGPIPPFVVSMAHDVPRDRLIARVNNGVWQLTLTGTPTWSQLTTSGTPPTFDPRNDLFFDALRDRILEVGVSGNVWALSMDATPTWTSIANPPLPAGVHNPQIAHDAARDRLLWFGSGTLNDTWAFHLEGATWHLVEPGSPIPVRIGHSAVAATPWDALVIFGGGSNSTWRLPMTGVGRIEEVVAAGPTPVARSGNAAIYDPVRQRMIVFGGNDGTLLLNDTHTLTIGPTRTWSPLFTENSPPSVREESHAIYDPVRDRMVILGGVNGSTVYRDLLALTLGPSPTWVQLAPGTALPPFEYSDLVYDSQRDRLIAITTIAPDTRAWWMPAGGPYTWTEFGGGPFPLPSRRNFAVAYDPAGDRVLLHGGYDSNNPQVFGEFLRMNPETGQWSTAGPGLPGNRGRYDHTLTRDPGRERFVLFGGSEQFSGLMPNSAWGAGSVWFAKDPQTVLDVGPPPAPAGTLAFRRLWLAAPDRIAFELVGVGEQAVVVEAFDVAGRKLGASALTSGASPARSGEIRLAAAARSGLVFVRARQAGAQAAIRRLAVLR